MTKNDLIEIGKRVKAVRFALNIPQKDFAASLNITPSYLSQIERAKKDNPGVAFFFNLALTHNVCMDYIIKGSGDMFPPNPNPSKKDKKNYVNQINSMDDLVWLMEHSDFFKHLVMGAAYKIHVENEPIIKHSLKKP